jgi:predicted nucleotidyltransferase
MFDWKVQSRIQEHYEEVVNMGYEVVGVFLQGSQNYELAYEGSDIDSKAIVLPKFNDFILNKPLTSTTHVCKNNEHIDLKDIRLMFECFKKQNINFVEILFTKYYIIDINLFV